MRYGEVASALLENLDDMRKNFQNILIDYSPNDIFNVDETELYLIQMYLNSLKKVSLFAALSAITEIILIKQIKYYF